MTDTTSMTFGLVSKPKKVYAVIKYPDKIYRVEAKDLKELRKKLIASYKKKGCNKHVVLLVNDGEKEREGYGGLEFTSNGVVWVTKSSSRPVKEDGSLGKW